MSPAAQRVWGTSPCPPCRALKAKYSAQLQRQPYSPIGCLFRCLSSSGCQCLQPTGKQDERSIQRPAFHSLGKQGRGRGSTAPHRTFGEAPTQAWTRFAAGCLALPRPPSPCGITVVSENADPFIPPLLPPPVLGTGPNHTHNLAFSASPHPAPKPGEPTLRSGSWLLRAESLACTCASLPKCSRVPTHA